MKHVLIGAALAAALLATPATAGSGGKRRDVRVSVADLDLGTREGVAELDRRLGQAVVKACGTAHHLEPAALNEVDRCRAAARARAMITRSALLGGQSGGAAADGAK